MDPARPPRGLRSNFLNEPREDPGPDPRWAEDHRTVPLGDPLVSAPRPALSPGEASLVRKLGEELEGHQARLEERDCAGMDFAGLLGELAERNGFDPGDPSLGDLLLADEVMEEWDWFAE